MTTRSPFRCAIALLRRPVAANDAAPNGLSSRKTPPFSEVISTVCAKPSSRVAETRKAPSARNVVNVMASHVVVACRGTGGTLSEIALALRFKKPVVLLDFDPGDAFLSAAAPDARWSHAATPADAAELIRGYLAEMDRA